MTVSDRRDSTDVRPALGRDALGATSCPQLSRSNPPPTLAAVEAMLAHEAITQFLAREDDGTIVGVATLAVFPIPTGRRAWIEDVIVDEASAGQGIGAQLTNAMLDHARRSAASRVDLTSRPSREAANHLYKKLGFQPARDQRLPVRSVGSVVPAEVASVQSFAAGGSELSWSGGCRRGSTVCSQVRVARSVSRAGR